MAKRIVLLASGTRGDVQPYLALARALQQRGHQISVATHASFESLAARANVPTTRLADNPSDWLGQHPHALTASLRGMLLSVRYQHAAQPMLRRMLDSALHACHDADVIIGGLPTLWADSIAQRTNARMIWAFLQPLSLTHEMPISILPMRLPHRLNHASYQFVSAATWLPWRATINAWRTSQSLPTLGVRGLLHDLHAARQPVVYGFGESVVPRPQDWTPNIHLSGFWFLDESRALSADVEQFINARNDVIYIGKSSAQAQFHTHMSLWLPHILGELNLRAIVNAPANAIAHARIMCVEDVSHAALFPLMRAVVQHGGAGTLGATLRAGVPSVVVPSFADQHFWAQRTHALGVAPAPLSASHLSPSTLRDAIHQAVSDSHLRANARALAANIQQEHSAERAADVIDAATR